MCAIEAGKRGRRVVVLEHSREIGKKIFISGGGRCNFTNLHCRPESFLSANSHFAKSALARYTARDFIALVEKHRIPYHEKTLGQLFCDRSAREIVAMLQSECDAAGVRIVTGWTPVELQRDSGFLAGEYRAPVVVVATGGLSIPKTGATDFGYRAARQFGLRVQQCRPALVPLVLGDADRSPWTELSGVSTEISASIGKARFREKMLFTHRGLSGPAILQASSYWPAAPDLEIDLLPGVDLRSHLLDRKRRGERVTPKVAASAYLPKRLADRWFDVRGQVRPLVETPDRELEGIASELHHWRVRPAGTEGYGKAEVTAGGVDTSELSSKTMEARNVPGLFFIGEVVDVTGHLGGYNFQWAWSSGFCAGEAIGSRN